MYIKDNNSIYDVNTHTPYPTIDFIRQQTGEDMIVLVGNELKAQATIRQITDTFKRELRKYHLVNNFNFIEYLIATDDAWRFEFISTVAAIIYDHYNTTQELKDIMLEAIEGSQLLRLKKILLRKYEYHKGY